MVGCGGRRGALAFALLSTAILHAEPAWGPASSGLVLGVDVGLTYGNERRLRVHFRNASRTAVEFGVGGASGAGSMYSVEITSVAPAGTSCKLLNLTVGFIAGYVEPVVMRLAPGAKDYVSIDLSKLICITGRATVTLETLLQQRHSVRASFTTTAENSGWAKVPNGWTGAVVSGVFHREPAKQPVR